ncbi:MAG: hypothetical protein JWR09_1872 [Mucilaginibacter sp.]|nr:hypothetical protein [Mucilaginibacter sp.]
MPGFEINTCMHGIFAGNRVDTVTEVRIYLEMSEGQADQAEADQYFHRL